MKHGFIFNSMQHMALPTPLRIRARPLPLSTAFGRQTDGNFDLTLVFVFLRGVWEKSFLWIFCDISYTFVCWKKNSWLRNNTLFGPSFSMMPSLQLVWHVLYGACEMAGADGVNWNASLRVSWNRATGRFNGPRWPLQWLLFRAVNIKGNSPPLKWAFKLK